MDNSFRPYMTSPKINWLAQRISALILMPLTLWFIYKLIKFDNYSYSKILSFFESVINSSLFLIMVAMMLYHSKIGLQMIVEDYIYSSNFRNNIIFLINILSYLLMVVSVLSIIIIQLSK